MGRNRVVNNDCAVIYGNTNQQDTCIKWELKDQFKNYAAKNKKCIDFGI